MKFISKFDYVESQRKALVPIQLQSPNFKLAAHLENVFSQITECIFPNCKKDLSKLVKEFVQSKIMFVKCTNLKIMAPRMTEYILDLEVKPHIIHGKMNPKIHLNENKLNV